MAKHLVVIGGGAAGFFCAVNAAAASENLRVTILEKSGKLLSKVKASGGGRCNTTHACFDIAELSRRYPRGQHFVKKAFHWFNPGSTIEWFASRGVELKAEADGRMFPVTDNSQTIVDCLLKEAAKYQVDVQLHSEVKEITTGPGFRLTLADGKIMEADFVCIATGGYPKSAMFDWLKQTGHFVEEPVPSLFTFNMPGNGITALMGVSVEHVQVKVQGTKLAQEGPLLITHWGVSGPAVLRLSAWGARILSDRQYRFRVVINWLPAYNEQSLRAEWAALRDEYGGQKTGSKNPFGLPSRLWLFLLQQSGIDEGMRWADLSSKAQNKLISLLVSHEHEVNGKTTFKEEFVTCGGIRLSEIDPSTMQSRIVPNLFFAGEVMDVDGITGGFNFQHAWTSGWLAANTISLNSSVK